MCGIAGIVYARSDDQKTDWAGLEASIQALDKLQVAPSRHQECSELLLDVERLAYGLTEYAPLYELYGDRERRESLSRLAQTLTRWEESARNEIFSRDQEVDSVLSEAWNALLIRCRDLIWKLEVDVLCCLARMEKLLGDQSEAAKVFEAWKLAVVLENIGRMEVRGRDSLGISVSVHLDSETRADFGKWLEQEYKGGDWSPRLQRADFVDGAVLEHQDEGRHSFIFTYKVAQEVGALGDNVRALYEKIAGDACLWKLFNYASTRTDSFSHTRWASNGIISEPNCHPVDEATLVRNGALRSNGRANRITACLNGDVDNHLDLAARVESETGRVISANIGTDAKVIPVLVDYYYHKTGDMREAFCKAVSECEGSIAIVLQNAAEPGRTYLALRGSGQSLFVGFCRKGYVFASELYGVVEQTQRFFRLDGTTERVPGKPETAGQVVVLDESGDGAFEQMKVYSFDGELLELKPEDKKRAEITTRDIDRKDFTHFLHKEISESPISVAQTLRGKFRLDRDKEEFKVKMQLGPEVVPTELLERLRQGKIRRIYWIGQGTAAVAGQAVAAVMDNLLEGNMAVHALKATELSGYLMSPSMDDALVIAISQSGTTTDTNRTVDMAREKGAAVLGIVNRRNSDLVYKVDGILYTSDGRDIEMSVASTKAFYSQVVAGYLLTYYLALEMGRVTEEYVYHELQELDRLPDLMRSVLKNQDQVKELARRYAPARRDWAVVGSGTTRAAASEIRIKLAELCYKSIATDHIEDKKHIDLSSEPLTLICAAGLSVVALKDAVKEVAIFRSHKSIPVVVCSEGFDAFEPYAAGVVYVPKASTNASVLLNVIVGHLWGYYCALAIDEGADRLREARASAVDFLTKDGGPETAFLKRILVQARRFQQDLIQGRFNSSLSVEVAVELTALLAFLGGVRSLKQFSEEYQESGTPRGLAAALVTVLSKAIHELTRPIDAIKHQAKTITVGISRLEDSFEGALFKSLEALGVSGEWVTYRDSAILRALTPAIEKVRGATCYEVDNLGSLGEPRPESTVKVTLKLGAAEQMTSRADDGQTLVGNKERTVRSCSMYLGLGSRDQLPIAIVPIVPRGRVEKLALLHLNFKTGLPLDDKVSILRNLGQRYDDIKALVTEKDLDWDDELLNQLEIQDLVTLSVSRVANRILASPAVR